MNDLLQDKLNLANEPAFLISQFLFIIKDDRCVINQKYLFLFALKGRKLLYLHKKQKP